jgi:hypothetical protein
MTFARSPWAVVMVLVAALLLSIGHRPTLQAQQPTRVLEPVPNSGLFEGGEYKALSSPPVVHVPARPMTLEATRVYLKLKERIPMEFPKETALGDVLKYIRSSTVDEATMPGGIPIYLDPVALNDADKSLNDKITIDMKGIPLATTLDLILHHLGMMYELRPEGFLFITNPASNESLQPDIDTLILDNLSAVRDEVHRLRLEIRELRVAPSLGSNPAVRPVPNTTNGNINTGGGFR